MSGKLLAYVLAGGESSRMQQAGAAPVDKSMLVLEGQTLLERALELVGTLCAEPRILCGPGHRCTRLQPFGPTVPDKVAFSGPVGALHAALHDALIRGADSALLMPVDLPWMPAAHLDALVQHGVASGALAACMRDSESVQPLPCLVHVGALPQVESALERRELKLLPLLRAIAGTGLCVVDLPAEADSRAFWNINTPADYQSAQAGETAGSSLHQSKHGRRATGN